LCHLGLFDDGYFDFTILGHHQVATLAPYQFIGEMSLLSRLVDHNEDSAATADVIVDQTGATFIMWDLDLLALNLQSDREVQNALSAYMSYDLREKLIRSGQVKHTAKTI